MIDNAYYIGINITKAKFDMASVSDSNKTHKVFQNNQAGFDTVLSVLQSKKIPKTYIVMEATNVYWSVLAK